MEIGSACRAPIRLKGYCRRNGVSTERQVDRSRDAAAQPRHTAHAVDLDHLNVTRYRRRRGGNSGRERQRVDSHPSGQTREDSNEKPTGDAAVEKSYYIPYAYSFLFQRADRGLDGQKMVPLKQHGRREATPTHEGAGTADIHAPRVPAVLSRNRRLSRRL
jgi:hypothetical protein